MKPSVPPDELRDLDLGAAGLDLEADRVSDQDRDREPEQHGRKVDDPRRELEHRAQARHPLSVELHEVGLRQLAKRGRDAFHVARGAARRPDDDRIRQRVALQRVERRAEAGVGAKVLERGTAVDELHARDVWP